MSFRVRSHRNRQSAHFRLACRGLVRCILLTLDGQLERSLNRWRPVAHAQDQECVAQFVKEPMQAGNCLCHGLGLSSSVGKPEMPERNRNGCIKSTGALSHRSSGGKNFPPPT